MITVSALLLLAAHAEPPPPPIVGGEQTDAWPAIGALAICGERCETVCTATLIAPTWILTAAHCADEVAGADPDTVAFLVGAQAQMPEQRADIVAWQQHPDFAVRKVAGSPVLTYDLALGELAVPLNGVEPLPLNVAAVNSSWLDVDFTYVGYGFTDDDADDAGTKHTAGLPLVEYDNYNLIGLDRDSDTNTCFGDSGGPMLRWQDGFGYSVAGVNSFISPHTGETPCRGGLTASARVDIGLDFIGEHTSYDDNADTIDPPDTGTPGDSGEPEVTDTGSTDKGTCSALPRPPGPLAALLLLVVAARARRPR